MDLLVLLVLLALVVLFVSAPLRRAPDPAAAARAEEGEASQVVEREAARDAKLRERRDAELDRRTGKLSDEDFRATDDTLRREALEILRELDEARAETEAETDPDTATISDRW